MYLHAHSHTHPSDSEAHCHSHNYTEANQRHFDVHAQSYDDRPGAVEMARRLAAAMRKAYAFDEDTTMVMDYACGTGLISRELAAYCKGIVGVDISPRMVAQYNARVDNQGIPRSEMHAVCVDLQGRCGELDGAMFDVIVCASAYHHFTSIKDVTHILASFLKPGGCLLVADLLKGENTVEQFPEDINHIVAHRGGFDAKEIREAFIAAGLLVIKIETVTTAKKHGKNVELFLAKGTK